MIIKHNKLKKEVVDLLLKIYGSWDSLDSKTQLNKVQIFKEVKNIYNNRNEVMKVFYKELEGLLKAVLIYNSKSKEYTVAIKNNSGIVYIFNNMVSGISLIKGEELIQENLSFQQLKKSEDHIILNIEGNVFLKNIINKNFEEYSIVDLNKNEDCDLVKDNNIYIDDFEDINPNKKEPFISSLNISQLSKNLKLREEEMIEIQSSWSFNEKINKYTGFSLEDNSNKGYSQEDKMLMTIDFNNENSFEKILFPLILLSEDFYSTIDSINIIDTFFKINANKVVLMSLLMIKQDMWVKGIEKEYVLSERNKVVLNLYNTILSNNVLVCVDVETLSKVVAVDLRGHLYNAVNGTDVLQAYFSLDVEEFSELNKIPEDYNVGESLYFKKNSELVNNVDMLSVKKKNIEKEELLINGEEFLIIKTVDLIKDNAIVARKHEYMFNNINDLLLNYLKNKNLHYKREERVEDSFLELIFEVKDEYIDVVGELGKIKKGWSHKRKINRYYSFSEKLKLLLLKLK